MGPKDGENALEDLMKGGGTDDKLLPKALKVFEDWTSKTCSKLDEYALMVEQLRIDANKPAVTKVVKGEAPPQVEDRSGEVRDLKKQNKDHTIL